MNRLFARLAAAVMRVTLRHCAGEAREWGRAMEAEMYGLEGWEAVAWAWGCWWALLRGEFCALCGDGQEVLMMRDRLFARLGLGISLVFLAWLILVPHVREGLEAVWTGLSMQVPAAPDPARLSASGSVPEADAFALAALRSADRVQREAWADRAVQADPRLTWIYFSLLQPEDPRPAAGRWVQALRRFDPDNGAILVLQAALMRHDSGQELPTPAWIATHPEWSAMMEQALRSPRWDSYTIARIQWERRQWQRSGERLPFTVIYGLFRHAMPSMREIDAFARWKRRKEVPDVTATIDFGLRILRGSRTTLEEQMARNLISQGYKELSRRSAGKGDPAEAERYLAIARSFDRPRPSPFDGPFAGAARWAQSSTLAMLASALVLLTLALLNVARRWRGRPYLAAWMLPLSAAGAVVFAILLSLAYRPFVQLRLEWDGAPTSPEKILPLAYFLDGFGLVSLHSQVLPGLWLLLTVLLSALAAYLIARQLRPLGPIPASR
jgi:hypothetical protein